MRSHDFLDALVDAAMAGRPRLDRNAFAQHLATIVTEDGDVAIDEVALAFAAAQGDANAVSELYAIVDRAARPALAVAGYTPAITDDTIQETSIRLLVGPIGEARPLLLGYRGRAPLSSWIKTIALRTAARLVEINRRISGDDSMLTDLAAVEDPARDVLRAELRPAVRAAYASAAKSLSYVDRELLAAVIVRGETIDSLARSNGIHRATAARWVGRARAALDDALRRELASTLELPTADVDSLLTAIATSIELTPGQLLDAKRRR
jgi:RNA polymerase sigma-70 factor (ECF subfamily)